MYASMELLIRQLVCLFYAVRGPSVQLLCSRHNAKAELNSIRKYIVCATFKLAFRIVELTFGF